MAHPRPDYDRNATEFRGKLQRYLDRTGFTIADFAVRINYSRQAVHHFLQGRYQGNPKRLISAAQDFMHMHPIAPPTTMEGKLYDTANVRAWRDIFYECLDRSRAAVVYGPPGIQKSFPIENLVAELNASEISKNGHGRRAYSIYCREGITPSALLKRIAEACGTSPLGGIDRVLRNLRFDFGNRRVLLIFDEAQHLSIACLETVRELLDRLHCGLIFAGSHDLILMFRKSIELEQWNRRLRHAVALPGMSEDDARAIVVGELGEVTKDQLGKLITKSTIEDPRRRQTYISAGRLFSNIQEIQEDPRFVSDVHKDKHVLLGIDAIRERRKPQ